MICCIFANGNTVSFITAIHSEIVKYDSMILALIYNLLKQWHNMEYKLCSIKKNGNDSQEYYFFS